MRVRIDRSRCVIVALLALTLPSTACSRSVSVPEANTQPANTAPMDGRGARLDQTPDGKRDVVTRDEESADVRQTAATDGRVEASSGGTEPPGPTSWASFRNGPRQLGIAASTLPEYPQLLWKHRVEYGVVTAAAIVGNHVYVGALSGFFFCLDRATGDVLWKYRSIDSPDPEAFAPGFISPPTVTADSIYVGDEDGMLHAIDRSSGTKRWTFRTGAEIPGGAAIVGDNVIVGSHDSFLYCLRAVDGSEVWKFETLDRINCSPAIADHHTFVAGCDEHLRVINIATAEQTSDIPLGSYLIASPAVLGDMLYVGTYASEVLAVNWKTEEVVWIYRDPQREQPYHASAAVTEEYVVVGGRDKQLHCIDRATGEAVWKFPTRGRIDSSPVIVGDRVFFGSSDRNVYAVRLEDGSEAWKYNVGGDVRAAPAVGEGVLVIGSEGSPAYVFCFGESPQP